MYAGGLFVIFQLPNLLQNLAMLNGDAWEPLGSGITGQQVNALVSMGSDLIVGAYFSETGGNPASGVARWNGSAWSPLGAGVSAGLLDGVHAMAVDGETLYVTGYFTTAGDSPANAIAKWENGAWSTLGDGISSAIGEVFLRGRGHALAVREGRLYVGGEFSRAGPLSINNVAMWDGTHWLPLGAGVSGSVLAIAQSGSDLYVGGIFETAGGAIANSIACWDGMRWQTLGSGVASGAIVGQVHAIAVHGENVYAGGVFTSAGGISAANVARWDGQAWSALGGGLTGFAAVVRALAVDANGNLYAAGFFNSAGGVSVSGIAKWNGTSWEDVGGGLHADGGQGEGRALLLIGDDLYVGGVFNFVGSENITGLAKWDGAAWSSVGSGVNATVLALAREGGDLYAGGFFTEAGGAAANRIARWTGSQWQAFGTGLGEEPGEFVAAISVHAGNVYAGGVFTNTAGTELNHLAVWNGTAWESLGGGTAAGSPPAVYALEATEENVFVGGTFQSAGGIPSLAFAAWQLQTQPRPTLSLKVEGSVLTVQWTSEPGATYQVVTAPRLGQPFQPLGDPVVSTGNTTTATFPLEGESGFFALEKVD